MTTPNSELDLATLEKACPEITPHIFAPEGKIIAVKPISGIKKIIAIAARMVELYRLVEELEWAGEKETWNEYDGGWDRAIVCPLCGKTEEEGHDCRLKQALEVK